MGPSKLRFRGVSFLPVVCLLLSLLLDTGIFRRWFYIVAHGQLYNFNNLAEFILMSVLRVGF